MSVVSLPSSDGQVEIHLASLRATFQNGRRSYVFRVGHARLFSEQADAVGDDARVLLRRILPESRIFREGLKLDLWPTSGNARKTMQIYLWFGEVCVVIAGRRLPR